MLYKNNYRRQSVTKHAPVRVQFHLQLLLKLVSYLLRGAPGVFNFLMPGEYSWSNSHSHFLSFPGPSGPFHPAQCDFSPKGTSHSKAHPQSIGIWSISSAQFFLAIRYAHCFLQMQWLRWQRFVWWKHQTIFGQFMENISYNRKNLSNLRHSASLKIPISPLCKWPLTHALRETLRKVEEKEQPFLRRNAFLTLSLGWLLMLRITESLSE